MSVAEPELDRRVQAVRRFNRFYTKQIGVLNEGLVRSPFSLTEARVLYELANRDGPTATELGRTLGLDAGYLSRLLRSFEKRRLITRAQSDADGRQSHLRLTREGKAAFARLNAGSADDVRTMLGSLPSPEQHRLVEAMRTIEGLLDAGDATVTADRAREPYLLRGHRPGDIGWIIHRHGVLYAQEYGWDERFEALVADIAAKFILELNPKRERCWIAERDGEIVGSIFLVEKSKTVSQLRLLLVEPKARGLGIGKRLVDECLRFARQVGYRKMVLWTNSILDAARHIYEENGFRKVKEEKHHSFGHDLVAQTWEKEL